MKKLLVAVLFCSLYAVPSFAILDLGVVGGVSQMTEPTTSSSATTYNVSANTGRSYGLLAQFHTAFGLGLSLGALYSEVNFHSLVTSGGTTLGNSDALIPYYQFPVIGNYWFGGILAFGLGAYYAIPGGNVSTGGTTGSFASQNIKTDDYGLLGDFQIRVPLGMITYLSAMAIYEYGLENTSTLAGFTAHNQGFLFLVGLGIGF